MDINTFTTQKSLELYTRNLINSIGICSSLKNISIDNYNFFLKLFERHPDYPKKIDGIYDISICNNKINNNNLEINIIKTDGSKDNISWKSCISGKKRNGLYSAMRYSIYDQICNYRNSSILQCSICKINSDNIQYHVDHINYFEYLAHKFIYDHNPPKSFNDTYCNTKCFKNSDKDFEDKWKVFHKNEAKLQILCCTCNLKREKWNKSQ